MAGDTQITIIGNLVADPELRYTNGSGTAVANFRIASTPRRFDSQSNQWVDGEALFLTCSIWRQAAENVANSLTKGDRVIVVGKLKQRSYEKDGQQRTTFEVEVDEVGPSLQFSTANTVKAPAQGGGSGWNQPQQAQPNTGHQGDNSPWNQQQSPVPNTQQYGSPAQYAQQQAQQNAQQQVQQGLGAQQIQQSPQGQPQQAWPTGDTPPF